jgi:hypothetical protein
MYCTRIGTAVATVYIHVQLYNMFMGVYILINMYM